jgi:DNA-binding CsgD family transcriptional regulator
MDVHDAGSAMPDPFARPFAAGPMAAGTSSEAAMAHAALDMLAALIFVVDGERRVRMMNRAASEAVADGGDFTVRDGVLGARPLRADARLAEAVASVGRCRGARDAFRLSRPSAQHGELQVSVSGLMQPGAAGGRETPLALIAATRPADDVPDARTLRALFGLTVSEAATLCELLSGRTLEECAGHRRVALSTVRTQLNAIFDKTGARTQAQLMVIAKSLPATLASAQPIRPRAPSRLEPT